MTVTCVVEFLSAELSSIDTAGTLPPRMGLVSKVGRPSFASF